MTLPETGGACVVNEFTEHADGEYTFSVAKDALRYEKEKVEDTEWAVSLYKVAEINETNGEYKFLRNFESYIGNNKIWNNWSEWSDELVAYEERDTIAPDYTIHLGESKAIEPGLYHVVVPRVAPRGRGKL